MQTTLSRLRPTPQRGPTPEQSQDVPRSDLASARGLVFGLVLAAVAWVVLVGLAALAALLLRSLEPVARRDT